MPAFITSTGRPVTVNSASRWCFSLTKSTCASATALQHNLRRAALQATRAATGNAGMLRWLAQEFSKCEYHECEIQRSSVVSVNHNVNVHARVAAYHFKANCTRFRDGERKGLIKISLRLRAAIFIRKSLVAKSPT
jgi:hypothetical protein